MKTEAPANQACVQCGELLESGMETCFVCGSATRPLSATVIGWAAIILGCAMLIRAAEDSYNHIRFRPIANAVAEAEGEQPTLLGVILSLKIPPAWTIFFDTALALVTIAAGRAMLQLRSWGRRFLIVIFWLLLLFTLVYGTAIAALAVAFVPESPVAARYVMTCFIGLMMVLQIALIAWALKHLHSRRLKSVFARHKGM